MYIQSTCTPTHLYNMTVMYMCMYVLYVHMCIYVCIDFFCMIGFEKFVVMKTFSDCSHTITDIHTYIHTYIHTCYANHHNYCELWCTVQVSDVDNDVRRAAVTALGFILFRWLHLYA